MRKLLLLCGVLALAACAPTSIAFASVGHLRGHHDGGGYNGGSQGGGPGDDRGDGHDYPGGGFQGGGFQGPGDRDGRGYRHVFVCNGTYTGVWVRDLVVPPSGVCLLTNSIIDGGVAVRSNGDFEAGTTSIRGDVQADGAQTVYVYAGSTVNGDINTDATSQTQIFDSSVTGEVRVQQGTGQVYLCNDTVGWGIAVRGSGPNILVGDHLDPNCPGNVVNQGNIVVSDNATYVELSVGDNSVPHGSIFVTNNQGTPVGTSGENVQGNQGGYALVCEGNASPFLGSPNPGWAQYVGQCSA